MKTTTPRTTEHNPITISSKRFRNIAKMKWNFLPDKAFTTAYPDWTARGLSHSAQNS